MILKPDFLSSILNFSKKGPCGFLADAFSRANYSSDYSNIILGLPWGHNIVEEARELIK